MGVYIRGMKMPKNCDECPCYYETEGAWRNECEVLGKEYIADDYRPEWCPLVDIPPHGRLIDADALKLTFCKECTLYPSRCLENECDWHSIAHLRMVPTIIEAESEDV